MTRSDKPVTRLSYSTYQGREIVVSIHPSWLSLRLKGTRCTFTLDILAAYQLAARAAAEAARREKRELKLAAKTKTKGVKK